MRKKWKYIIIAVGIILVLFLAFIPQIKTGIAEQTGGFNFIQKDEHGVTFIYTPPAE